MTRLGPPGGLPALTRRLPRVSSFLFLSPAEAGAHRTNAGTTCEKRGRRKRTAPRLSDAPAPFAALRAGWAPAFRTSADLRFAGERNGEESHSPGFAPHRYLLATNIYAPAHLAFFHDITFATGVARWDGLPREGLPEVALIGRSNVGKSSLLNALTARKQLARVSRTPGKTREFNFYRVTQAGFSFFLVDVPGFGYAKVAQTERAKWAALIERYATEREALRLVCHLVDARHEPTALDRTVFDAMRGARAPYVVVLTKADKLSGNGRAQSEKQTRAALVAHRLPHADVVLTSAEDGRGIEALHARIAEAVGVTAAAEARALAALAPEEDAGADGGEPDGGTANAAPEPGAPGPAAKPEAEAPRGGRLTRRGA